MRHIQDGGHAGAAAAEAGAGVMMMKRFASCIGMNKLSRARGAGSPANAARPISFAMTPGFLSGVNKNRRENQNMGTASLKLGCLCKYVSK